jgi:hypothetical protein
MASFSEIDWTRFDVHALVVNAGVAVVEPQHRQACHGWLGRNRYAIDTINFGGGIGPAVMALGSLLRWVEQFGYALEESSGNLDALRDGFLFETTGSGVTGAGRVLELLHADAAYREDPRWLLGLLAIAAEHSRQQLALGQRFFTVLVLEPGSALPGVTFESLAVPHPFRSSAAGRNPFER